MKIDREEWRKSVEELSNRLDRCENYVLGELMTSGEQSPSVDMATKDLKTHSYRDKNTLVEVTIHTRGKPKETTRNLSWDRSLEKENTAKSFAKPTRASLEKENNAKGFAKASRSSSGKNVSNSPKHIKRKKSLENNAARKGVEEDAAKQKSIRQLLEELRGSFRESGIKDFYEFLDEVDGGRSRSERQIAESTKSLRKNEETIKSPKKTEETKETTCQKLEHKQIDEETRRLSVEVKKYKSECARYKTEYDIIQKQLSINRESQASMETQINDLKKIISKLTHNNSELLGLISTRAGQEDQLTEAEQKISGLTKQLYAEKSRVKDYEERFLEQEAEISKLRRLTSDLKAHLHHGLEGLDLPRSRPVSRPQDNTRDILGLTAMSEAFKGNHSQSEDSAIEDPESRQSSTPRAATRYNSKPSVAFSTKINKNQAVNNVVEPIEKTKDNVLMPSSSSQTVAKPKNAQPGGGADKNVSPSVQGHQPNLIQNNKLHVQMPGSVPTFQPQPPPALQTSGLLPNLPSQSFNIDRIKKSNHDPPQKVNVLPLKMAEEIDDNVTGVENLANVNPQVFRPDSQPVGSIASTFQPIPLDLSDTLSSNAGVTQLDMDEYQPATLANKNTTLGAHIGVQQNLENKVQAFLDKLHQDSLNLSLPELPKARSFQGPTMQLSISGGSDLDDTRDTTLTERKFLRGLETSIEVLPAEITHSSN